MPELVARANQLVELMIPGARPVPFGHLGDGNIHYNVSQPLGMDRSIFLSSWETLNAAVHEIVLDLGGSISAEHGIGRLKRDLLPHAKQPLELGRKIKPSTRGAARAGAACGPGGRLQPGEPPSPKPSAGATPVNPPPLVAAVPGVAAAPGHAQ